MLQLSKTVGESGDLMSQSCHPLLSREEGTTTPPTFERENFQVGNSVFVVFNEETNHYILLSASRSIYYFVHENCLKLLGLPPPAECVDKSRDKNINIFQGIFESNILKFINFLTIVL
jgi:hypothetical protein